MVDVPDINPMRPVWRVRPDEKSSRRRRLVDDERNKEKQQQQNEYKENNREPGNGHVDEYV